MIIVPKVSEYITDLDNKYVYDYINGILEIQLLDLNILNSVSKIEDFLKVEKIETLIVHLPMSECDINLICCNEEYKNTIRKLIVKCSHLSNIYNKNITILFHDSLIIRYSEELKCKEFINELLSLSEESNVDFLIENSTVTLNNAGKSEDGVYMLVKEINNDRVRMCLDLCHYDISNNVLKGHYKFPKYIIKYIKSVHFSKVLNDDGIVNVKTHGRVHLDIDDCKNSLDELVSLGIDIKEIYIVTEINEEDYINRPDMVKELYYLHTINKSI